MTEHQRDILREAHEQMEEKRGLVWGPEWMEEVAAALRALLYENAALKAERDEARRELCHYKFRSIMDEFPDADTAPQIIAENRGWKCFGAKGER